MCVLSKTASSQQEKAGRLRVFVDCSRTFCDQNFIRSEIRMVDFLLDRTASDVHVLITSQPAGGGGRQYQMIFYGQNAFVKQLDTLFFNTGQNATSAEVRDQLVHHLKLGLVPFVLKTPNAVSLKIDMRGSGISTLEKTEPARDPWNFWVLRIGVNGDLSADRVYKSNRFSADFSADHTTDDKKISFYVYGSKRASKYQIEDNNGTNEYTVRNNDYGIFHDYVKSVTDHWSIGYQADYSSNTFSNFKHKLYYNPALEYNIFPYNQVNNRFFVIRYGLDVTAYRYYDTTLYNKIKETQFGHKFSAALTLNQKWGTFNSGIYYRNYFSDWRLNSMGMNLNVNVRVTGGLSFYFNANGGIVHDQIYLVKGEATEQEILTRRRQVGSSYNFRTSFGVNYRFGSKLNNFINPRFDGYGGF